MKTRNAFAELTVLLALLLTVIPLAVAVAGWLTAGPVVDLRL